METWKTVVGFEGYEVSSHGRVRSYRPRSGRGGMTDVPRILRFKVDRDGYHQLTLRRSGKDISRRIHVLVLEAFVGPRVGTNEGLHNDGNPSNNRLDNLRWGTPQENSADKKLHGTNRNKSNLTAADVIEIRKRHDNGERYRDLAREFKISARVAGNIVRRKTWDHI